MKKLIIIGAGQMGMAVRSFINYRFYDLIAYGDNMLGDELTNCQVETVKQTMKCNDIFGDIPIYSVKKAVALNADVALIAVVGHDREEALKNQLLEEGFDKQILFLSDLSDIVDIRVGTTTKLAKRLVNVDGAVAELGVYRGDFARLINILFAGRKLYLFDTFSGFDDADIAVDKDLGYSKADKKEFEGTSVEVVLDKLPYPKQAVVCEGHFPESAKNIEQTFALVSIDVDLYKPTFEGLKWFLPRLAIGGVIIVHDYDNARFKGVAKAVEDYEREYGRLSLIPLCDLHGTAIIIK